METKFKKKKQKRVSKNMEEDAMDGEEDTWKGM